MSSSFVHCHEGQKLTLKKYGEILLCSCELQSSDFKKNTKYYGTCNKITRDDKIVYWINLAY